MKFEEEEFTVHNLKRRIMGSLMAVLMSSSTILGTCPAPIFATASNDATVETEVTSDATSVDANQYGLASETEGNILHAWDWKFTDVTKNMKEIAESGYSNVQVSPCQTIRENVTENASWWQFYQPTDFTFGNSLGNAEEFKAMCDEAEKYGVNVIVDIVSNHLAGSDTALDAKVADKWKNNTGKYFHNYGSDYKANSDTDRKRMVTGTIGMPDLNTEDAEVQSAITGYLGELMDMGADGFRFDAAKHIGTPSDSGDCQSNYWKVISEYVKGKNPNALLYGEILNEIPVSIDYYTPYIKVTESQKGWDMKDLTHGSSVSQKLAFNYKRTTSDKNLITWVESHDTFCNAQQETGTPGTPNYMTNDQIILCWSTVASRANAQSLFFARPEGITGSGNGAGRTVKVLGDLGINTKDNSWKDPRVAAVNKFKNAMAKEGENCSTNGNLAIVKRGNKGVVVTNFGSNSADFSVDGLSGLKDGTYKDASGQNGEFTVSGGKVSGQVKGNTFVVLFDADATPVETEVPATTEPTEPTETPVEGAAQITVSKDSGEFEKAFDVDVKVENAEYAYYSYDGADWAEIKDGKATVTVGEDAKEVGDEFALYVKAKGKDGKTVDVAKTYTFAVTTTESVTTTAEPTTKGLKLRIPKADVDFTPYVYFYEGTKYVGKDWPGTAMTLEGDYYVFEDETMTGSYNAIFNNGKKSTEPDPWQDPIKDATPYKVSGFMEYSKANKKVTEVKGEDVTVTTSVPATVSPNAKKAGVAPEFTEPSQETPPVETTPAETEPPVVETEPPVEPTEVPTEAPTAEPTTEPEVEASPCVEVSVPDQSEFDADTMDVTLTLKDAEKGTYTIDGGITKTFVDATTVTIGEGKIGNTDVTLKVTATDGNKEYEYTYTYKKVFNPGKEAQSQQVTTSAVKTLQSLFEVVADAKEVNALSGEPESSYYATNPNKQVGSKKTIKSAADFSESDIIAQGVANDGISIFKGSHEGPVYDSYALFGAYDDQNVYIGVQYVNVIDVVDPAQNYPQSDNGKPYAGDIPQMMVFDTGSGDYTDGTTNDAKQKTAWDSNVKFAGSAQVDKLFLYAAKPQSKNTAFFPVTSGIVDYTKVQSSKEGTDSGITYTYEDGFFCSKMYGVNGNGYAGYTPEELNSDSSNWVDFLTTSHSTSQDTFMIMTVPMSTLGVTADKIEKDGIGIMSISTYGASGIGCCPQDMSMLDVACQPYSKDDSTSAEKEDEDTVTVPLARLGGTVSTVPKTPRPITSDDPEVTETPAAETPVVDETPVAETPVVNETPVDETPAIDETPADETPAVDETIAPATDVPAVEETIAPATDAPVVTEVPTAAPIKVDVTPTEQMVVNFGAHVSAPQAAGTVVVLKAEPMNTTGTCQYQFAIDGELAQAYSESGTYQWTATAGKHTIQVSVKDEAGKTVGVVKNYTVEGEVVPTDEPKVTTEPTTVPTAVPTNPPVDNGQVPDAVSPAAMTVSLNFSPKKSVGVNKKVTITPVIANYKTSYSYSIIAKKNDGTVKTIVASSSAVSATWKPTVKGTYTIIINVRDAEGNLATKSYTYKVTKIALTAKASKKTIKIGKSIKFTAKATSVYGTAKFKYVIKRGSKTIASTKYTKKKTYTWKAKKVLKKKKKLKTGTYKCIVYAKDSSGITVTKTLKFKVKK